MDLSKIFLWLDIDGVILDWVKLKEYLGEEIFETIAPGGAKTFWQGYESLRDATGQVNFGKAIEILVQKYQFDTDLLTSRIRQIDFNNFLYDDFRLFMPKLVDFGGWGIFSQGTFWYQYEKVVDLKKLLPTEPKAVLITEDKSKSFDQMRESSLDFVSWYVDDRKIYLEMALAQKVIERGIWMLREQKKEAVKKEILPVANFTALLALLKE